MFTSDVLPPRVEAVKISDEPDKRMRFASNDNLTWANDGLEWSTPGKKVDVTDGALPASRWKTLIQLEGDDRPKYLIGNGHIIDVAASRVLRRIVAVDMYTHVNPDRALVITVGSPLTQGGLPVTNVLSESSHQTSTSQGEELFASPFEGVGQLLRNIQNEREKAGVSIPSAVSSLLAT